MRKLLFTVGIICILIGVVGVVSTNFNFGTNGTETAYEKEWTFTDNELKNLEIESSYSIDLKVVPSTGDRNSIHISGEASDEVIKQIESAVISNQTLKINLDEKIELFRFMDFSGIEKQQIVIKMSEQAQFDSVTTNLSASSTRLADLNTKKLNMDSSSGSITVTNLQADQAVISNTSGSITVNDLQGDQVEISNTSGSIQANGAIVTRMTLENGSGGIKGENIKGEVDATTTSGSIKFDELASDPLKLKSISGSIHVNQLLTQSADIEATSGSVKLTVPADFGGFYDLKSSSGSISAPESKRATNNLIKVKTTSGSISIKEQQ
jgi:DUF4097 and DUF4098 domain-containing protein YvlB